MDLVTCTAPHLYYLAKLVTFSLVLVSTIFYCFLESLQVDEP